MKRADRRARTGPAEHRHDAAATGCSGLKEVVNLAAAELAIYFREFGL